MRWCLLALLPLLAGAISHYEIEGVLSTITHEAVRHHLYTRAGFLPSEQTIRERLTSISQDLVKDFFIDFFEIHGEEHDRRTVIFHGYLSTDFSRIEIEKLVENTDDLHIFWLFPKASLPTPSLITSASTVVDSCSNNGVLLPNATCACRPFFSGDACEIVQCLHEGIQKAGSCACSPGVKTVNCEPRTCIPSTTTDFKRDKSSFILVINQEVTGAAFLNSFFGELQHLDYDSYNTFIVVNFVDSAKGLYMQKKEFAFWTDMIDYLNGIVSVSSGKYQQPTNKAILAAQSFAPSMMAFSRIIVITALPDSDNIHPTYVLSSTNLANRLILKTLAWRSRLLYIIPVVTTAPIPSGSFDVFHAVADATLGDVVYVDRSETASKFVVPMINTLYPSEPIQINNGHGDAHLNICESDLIVLVSVKPGETLPSVSSSNDTEVASDAYNKILQVSDSKTIALLKGTKWSLKASVQTTSTAVVAYSDDEEVDIGTAYAVANVPQFINGEVIGINGQVSLEIMDPTNANPTAALRFADCSYSTSFGKFDSFSTPGPFINYLKVADKDYYLYIPGVVVTLDEQTPPSFQCFNGGTKLSASSCQCVSGFLGKDCSVPMCLNGGSPNLFPGNGRDLCSCPQGHHGDHCEKLDCYSLEDKQSWSQDKSLALVIQSSMSQASINDDIGQGLVSLLVENNVAFSQLLLTSFNNVAKRGQNRTIITTTNFNSSVEFLNATSNVQYLASYTPTQDSFAALQNTLDSLLFDNSQVVLFVGSKPTSSAAIDDLTESALLRRTPVHVIMTSAFGDGTTCLDDSTRQIFQKLAFNTGGFFLNLCGVSEGIQEFFSLIASPFHNSQLALEDVPQSCSKPVSFALTFENGSDTYFVINGDNVDFSNFSVSVVLDGADVTTGIATNSGVSSLGLFKLNLANLDLTKEYNVHVISDPSAGQGLCSSKIIVQSSVQAFFGFTDVGSAASFKQLNFDDPTVVTFFLSDVFIQRASLLVTSAKKSYSFTSQFSNSACSSQVLFDEKLVCMSPNDAYLLKTLAQTQNNEVITRTQRAYCYLKSKNCLNGGTWQSGKCYCTTFYSGDYCEIPACQNGFSLDSNSQCFCSGSFTGNLCESEKCDSFNFMEAADVREFDFEQIIFVLNTNIDMLLVNVYLKNMIQKFTSEVQDPTNPREFTLVTFDEQNVTPVVSTSNEILFSEVFAATLNGFSKVSGQPTKSLDALHQALRLVVKPTATVFLVTGSSSLNPYIATKILPRQQLGAQINLIYSPPGLVPVTPPDDRLTTAARLSGGRVIPLSQNSLPVMEVVMASSLKENALVMDDAVEDCSIEVDRSFFADSAATRIIFDISGYGVWQNFVLRDTKGQVAKLSRNFTDTGILIAELELPEDGSGWGDWSFSLKTTTGSCFMQVRVESGMRVIPGFTMDAHNDFPTSQPFGERVDPPLTRMAFRLTGLQGAIITSVKVEDTVPAQPWNATDGHASANVHARDTSSCAFQFISDSFLLDGTSEYQKFNVWGMDNSGREFKRIFFYETPSQDLDCKNGAIDLSGKCTCDANHFGDECSERRCVNGGSSSFGVCACPSGFYGQFCEKYFIYNGTSTTFAYVTTTTPLSDAQTTTSVSLGTTPQALSAASTTTERTTQEIIYSSTTESQPVTTTVVNGEPTTTQPQDLPGTSTVSTTTLGVFSSSSETQALVVTESSTSQVTQSQTSTLGSSQTTITSSLVSETTHANEEPSIGSSSISTTRSAFTMATGQPSTTINSQATTLGLQTTTSSSATSVSTIQGGAKTTTVPTTVPIATESTEMTTQTNAPATQAAETSQGITSTSPNTPVVTTPDAAETTALKTTISGGTTQSQTTVQVATENTNLSSGTTEQTTQASVTLDSSATTTVVTGGSATESATDGSVTSSAASTSSSASTTEAITTALATTVAAIISTMEPTDGPCDPVSTTYFYSFFIDTADPGQPSLGLDTQHSIVSQVAASVDMGSGQSNTRFAISGVADDFYPAGVVTTPAAIDDVFNSGDLYADVVTTGADDYNKGIDGYLSSNYSDVSPNEKPAIAVLFASYKLAGTQNDFTEHVNKLKAANYAVIGIDLSFGMYPVASYFNAALGSKNVFMPQTPDQAAQFIIQRGCHFKPI